MHWARGSSQPTGPAQSVATMYSKLPLRTEQPSQLLDKERTLGVSCTVSLEASGIADSMPQSS